jgi:diguanylate cyclase (GGDEF)-like protein
MLSQLGFTRRLAVLTALAVAYIATAKLGLVFADVYDGAGPLSPATGIGLVACVVLGPRAWSAVFVGAFFVHLTTTGALPTSLGIALGRTVEAVLAAHLVTRAGGREAFGRPQRVLRFAVLAAGLSTAVGASLGLAALALGGHLQPPEYASLWVTWWLGGAAGNLVVAPVLLLWIADPRVRWRPAEGLEAVGVLLGVVLASQVVFGAASPAAVRHYSLEFICIVPLLWAAFRFGPREAATAVLLLAALAIGGTLSGFGPFVRPTPVASLLLLQAFTAFSAGVSLVVAATVAERRHVEARLRALSTTDPLTGLGNYRHLVATLENEIERAGRTGRPFALLFLDLDDLKVINDLFGHLVGSRALVRLADVLRLNSRVVDVAARYGGDEFAVVLPETDIVAAREVARRVAERLAADQELPPLTVSLGVAVFPRDGETAEALIGRADQTLYEMKARVPSRRDVGEDGWAL